MIRRERTDRQNVMAKALMKFTDRQHSLTSREYIWRTMVLDMRDRGERKLRVINLISDHFFVY